MSVVYMTASDRDEALKLARVVVEEQLVACANIHSEVTSVYRWEGKVEESPEAVVSMKTRSVLVPQVIERLSALHSYDCPCVVSWPLSAGHGPYLNWLRDQTASQANPGMNEDVKQEGDDWAPVRELTKPQRRILGVLLEKAYTTAEYYPLTLKATTTGANQKSNRSPVTNYTEDAVFEVLEELRELGLVSVVHTEGGRAERYRHNMRKRYSFTEPQLAILTELLLRGRQQVGELRSRASRMVPIESLDELRKQLRELIELGYVQSSGAVERRGVEVDHNFYAEQEGRRLESLPAAREDEPAIQQPEDRPNTAVVSQPAAPQAASDEVQAELRELRQESAALRAEVEALRASLESVRDEFSELKRELGV
ncbi:UPF0502 protein RB6530 [Durusdinium trenchii]